MRTSRTIVLTVVAALSLLAFSTARKKQRTAARAAALEQEEKETGRAPAHSGKATSLLPGKTRDAGTDDTPSAIHAKTSKENLSAERLLELAGGLDLRALQQLHYRKVREVVARDFPDFERAYFGYDFQTGEDSSDEDYARFASMQESFKTKHAGLASPEVGVHATWPILVGTQTGTLKVHLNPRRSYQHHDDGSEEIAVEGASLHVTIQLEKTQHFLYSGAIRLSKSDGEFWMLGSFAGCDPGLNDHYKAIAVRIPRSYEVPAYTRILNAANVWSDLDAKDWRTHATNVLDSIPVGTKVLDCQAL